MFKPLAGLPEGWCQVCVVGAGPVGLSLAMSLARQGLRVALLESGRAWRSVKAQALSELASFNSDHHSHSEATVVRAIGGASLRWGGRCVEFDDVDFMRRDYVPEGAWPIGHDELRSYYEPARNFLTAEVPATVKTAGLGLSLETWARYRNTARAHRVALRDERNLAVVSDCTATALRIDLERGCVSAVDCVSHGNRRVLNASAFVIAAGGRENARLLLDAQRSAADLFGGTDGPLGRYYMGHLTGQIAAIHFSSPSNAKRYFFGVASNGTVYRSRLKLGDDLQRRESLLNVAFWPDTPRPDEILDGDGAASLLHVLRHAASRARHPTMRQSGCVPPALAGHLRNAISSPWNTLVGASHMVRRKLSPSHGPTPGALSPTNRYLLRYHSEHLPDSSSRVTLSDKTDEHGCRRLDVDFRYAARNFESVVAAHRVMDQRLRRSGDGAVAFLKPLDELESFVRIQALDGYHQIGLTRMSSDRRTGVVDRNCKVHDLRNLFVAGSSIFPTSGQANPTLPAVAFALRLTDHLASSIF